MEKLAISVHIDNYWGIAVFASRNMLESLQQAQYLYINGTFCTAPHAYTQFLTIYGFVIPLVFCLMNGKTTGQYRQVIQHIKAKVWLVTQHSLQPTHVVLDLSKG